MLFMVSITFSIPEETKKTIKEFPEVNWTHLVRSAIEEKAKKLNSKKILLERLKKEKNFMDWSVEVVRKGRQKK